ncbi:MAG: hypothetical protein WEA80_12320 [Gemmatimonadaceae bacterium]
MTSTSGATSCAALLRDVHRRLMHEVNNAANGVAVNLEVVRTRTAGLEGAHQAGPFAERASEQFESLTALHEILRALLQLTIDCLEQKSCSCRLSPSGGAFEIVFEGTVIPRALSAERGGSAQISMRNSPDGVILTVPRTTPSSE